MHAMTDLILGCGGIVEWLDGLVISTQFTWGMLMILLGVLIALGQPLYVVLGATTAWLLLTLPDHPPYKDFAGSLNVIVEETRILSDKVELLAIPFFVLAGAIMTRGDIARRLVAVARAFFGWLPGGLAISAVAACMFFAAISGSSPVTVIAIGTMMYPVLTQERYTERFSAGLLSTAGSLGILIPPSIPMLIFAIVLGQVDGGWSEPLGTDGQPAYGNLVASSGLDNVGALFLAGVGPGILVGSALAIFSLISGRIQKVKTEPFDLRHAMRTVKDGFWSLMLPVLILGGIYTGTFTVTQAAAVAVVYSFVVEVFIHGQLELKDVPRIFSESAVLMGSLLLIIAMALGFNRFLVKAEIPELAVDMIRGWDMTTFEFLLVLNLLLLVVGCLMDIMSAILILVPLISPIALEMGVHPVHLAVIFIVNLEIGYLTPPLGLNLFVASTIFRKSLGEMVMSVLPFILIMMGCLVIVTYVPALAMGPLAIMGGKSPFFGFPETITRDEAAALKTTPVGNERSISELMADAPEEEVDDSGNTVTYPSADSQLTDAMSRLPDDAFLSLLDLADLMTGRHMHVVLARADMLEADTIVELVNALTPIYEAVDDDTLAKDAARTVFDGVVARIEPLDKDALTAEVTSGTLATAVKTLIAEATGSAAPEPDPEPTPDEAPDTDPQEADPEPASDPTPDTAPQEPPP